MADQPTLWNTPASAEPSPKKAAKKKAAKRGKQSPFDRAFHQAMQRLNRRAMSCSQVETKLRGLKHDDVTIQQVIDRLKQIGALDDAKLAREVIEQVQRKGPAGSALLRRKLAKYGFDEALVERVIAEAGPGSASSLAEQARAFVTAKLPSLARLAPAARLRRLAGLLARRGIDEDTIESVLSEFTTLHE